MRALDHAPVSFPFPWELLPTLRPHDMTIATVPAWVAEHGDAWAAMNDSPQSIEPFLDMVRRDQAVGFGRCPYFPVCPKMEGEPMRVAPSRAKKPKPEKPRATKPW